LHLPNTSHLSIFEERASFESGCLEFVKEIGTQRELPCTSSDLKSMHAHKPSQQPQLDSHIE